jgi:hypothetical protein
MLEGANFCDETQIVVVLISPEYCNMLHCCLTTGSLNAFVGGCKMQRLFFEKLIFYCRSL